MRKINWKKIDKKLNTLSIDDWTSEKKLKKALVEKFGKDKTISIL